MNDWKLKLGNFLFKHRSFTPLPFIVLVFVLFKPVNLGSSNWMVNIGGLIVSLIGEVTRILAVGFAFEGTSGRESYLLAENLNTTGIYSVLRNPLYVGNFLIFAGVVAVFSNLYALLIFAIFLTMQYYFVILAEENYLRKTYKEQYEDYCREVRRIIPTFNKYKRNQNPFNFKKVVFKENDSVFNMLIMVLLVLLYKEKVLFGEIQNSVIYISVAVVLIIAYIVVKNFKKRHAVKP